MRQGDWKAEYEMAALLKMRLYQRAHGLAPVLEALEVRPGSYQGNFWTDGSVLYLDGERLKREFLKDSQWLCLELLHIFSHCLLGHLGRAVRERRENCRKWDKERDGEAWELAEKIWAGEISLSEERFSPDTHEPWIQAEEKRRLEKAGAFGEMGSDGKGGAEESRRTQSWWEAQREKLLRECAAPKKNRPGTAFRRKRQRLLPVSGHRGDYREILRSFSAYGEESRVSQEEFQYAWYEYGLRIYGNMPLIEPLEYREEKRIRDLVIVIDTSASCEKELVRIFLEETKGILEQDDLFFGRFCLHIIQCDNRIQRDDRIASLEEFEAYLGNLEIVGGGGTDFRPAFGHIADLEAAGEFCDLRGALYFTDGVGLYPKEKPDYAVYFVMLEHHYDAIDMPDWIHRLVLSEI